MTHLVSLRIAALAQLLPDDARSALFARLGIESAAELADPQRIRARAASLDAETRDALSLLLAMEPAMLELAGGAARRLPAAEELGLVFFGDIEDGQGERVLVPLETRVALLDDVGLHVAPLAVLLGGWESDDLNALARIHGVELEDEGHDTVSAALHLADVLTDVERLDGVFESLPAPAKRLAHWLCELDGPVPAEMASAKARRFAELAGDPTATSEAILTRLGIAHEREADGDSLLLVPPDVRSALWPIVDTALSERCRVLYEMLRDGGYPAFRDIFPHGAGGNALLAARHRMLRADRHGADPRDLLDRVLTVFRVLDPRDGVGELASTHLDVATPERFAQESLRSWLGSLDDDFTRVLVEPFGGDCVALADWILEGEPPEDEDSEADDAEDWTTFLHDLRAQMVFVLSVLPPGQWFRLSSFASLTAAMYRRLMWHASGFDQLSESAPQHAFPMPGVDVTAEDEARLYEALVLLFAELLEPIGCVGLDATGQLFMVNPEALRLFRDGDPGFDVLWEDLSAFIGDDVDLWAPIPTSWGARVCGVAPLLWLDDMTAEIPATAHVADLLHLNQWAELDGVGGAFRFRFTRSSVARGAEHGNPEFTLLWLMSRSIGEMPSAIQQLFPVTPSPADVEEPLVRGAAFAKEAIDELEVWGETPPSDLVERVRAMGPMAGRVLVDALAARVESAEWDHPMLRHLAVLCGELGALDAVPLLLRTVGHSRFEPAEGAAASALTRIGEPAIDGLSAIVSDVTLDIDKRLAAAGALASIAALHPHAADSALHPVMALAAAPEDVPEDVPTLVGIFVAESGSPLAEHFLRQLRDQGLWMDEVMPFDEALWVIGLAPAVWGHPVYASPLAYLYPPRAEAERILQEGEDTEPHGGPRRR